MVTALTTEHFTIQTHRSAIVSESNARANLYLGALSGSTIALALVAQLAGLSGPFYVFAFTLLPAVVFMGVVTFLRLFQLNMQDHVLFLSAERIRRFYRELDPRMGDYLSRSDPEAVRALRRAGVTGNPRLQVFLTMASMLLVINGVVTGVVAALVTIRLGAPPVAGGIVGGVGALLMIAGFMAHQARVWRRSVRELADFFPGLEGFYGALRNAREDG